jgi:hypothetical protein
MRTPLSIVLFLFVLAIAAIVPGMAAAAESTTGFVAWALDRAGDMDLRWNRMTGQGGANTSEARDGTGTAAERSPSSARIARGTELSHSVITSRSFLRTVSTKAEFLPLSTRARSDAARGVARLQSPAKARLSGSFSVRRPLNSPLQQKNFFHTFGASVARPKLDSFGSSIHKTGHTRGRGVSRPASRADRPRLL